MNPWFLRWIIPAVGILVTALEIVVGAALLAGFYTRQAARLGGLLILAFAIGMTVGTGVKSALNASVLAASACGWLLARAERYPLSIDAVREARARAKLSVFSADKGIHGSLKVER